MNLRSLLFAPGDSERKLAKAGDAGADALILDLEDSVAPSQKPAARTMVRAFLDARPTGARRCALFVRINPFSEGALTDLSIIMGGAPDAIMMPKVDGPADMLRLSHYLDALEAREGLPIGQTQFLPVATETAAAPFSLGGYTPAGLDRLVGLTWGAEDLSTAIGASTNQDGAGQWALTYRLVRSLCLLAAKAASVQAIETLYSDYRDVEGLEASCQAAAREGFTGRIAIHPAQVEPINRAFGPSDDDVAFARRVIAAFDAQPESGTVGLDGRMLDIPHLKQARRILAFHEELRERPGSAH